MNRLLVDIGNSRIKWAVQTAQGRGRAAAAPHSALAAGDLRTLWAALPQVDEVVATNVAGETLRRLIEGVVRALWSADVRWIVARAAAGDVANAYTDPARLGADRWAALIGARAHTPDPVWVVDCGTALTIDALGADGRHLGGVIAPGLELMRRSLYATAPGIPDEGEGGEGPLGRDTRSAVSLGVAHAAAGFIEHTVAQAAGVFGGTAAVLLTGGDAGRIAGQLSLRHELVPELVLDGLAVLAEGEE